MALPDVFRVQTGASEITVKNSGGTAAISLASVSNGAARQSAKIDFGASRARRYLCVVEAELAATPTAGNALELYMGWSNSGTAGTDNPAGLSGSDAAYTGQSSNLDASVKQLAYLGDAVVSALATTTVQRITVGIVEARTRYGCLAVYNKSGAAFHSTNTNQAIRFIPIEDTVEDS